MKIQKIILIMASTAICMISTSCMDRDSDVNNQDDLLLENSSLLLKSDSADSTEIIVQYPPPTDRDNWRLKP